MYTTNKIDYWPSGVAQSDPAPQTKKKKKKTTFILFALLYIRAFYVYRLIRLFSTAYSKHKHENGFITIIFSVGVS